MKKQQGHLYEVRIYDGEGNLKEVVMPEIDYDVTSYGNPKKQKAFNKIPTYKKERYDELQSLGGDEKE